MVWFHLFDVNVGGLSIVFNNRTITVEKIDNNKCQSFQALLRKTVKFVGKDVFLL